MNKQCPLAQVSVLLVEDVPDEQRLYSTVLRQAGAEVHLECNGAAAVSTALAASLMFDVVIMDMMMPLLDGVAATRALRQQGYAGPILAVMADDDVESRQAWFEAGCNDYLSKPLSMPTLIQAILRLVCPAGCERGSHPKPVILRMISACRRPLTT
jgi:CheY-like chemotaxis protein